MCTHVHVSFVGQILVQIFKMQVNNTKHKHCKLLISKNVGRVSSRAELSGMCSKPVLNGAEFNCKWLSGDKHFDDSETSLLVHKTVLRLLNVLAIK